MHLIISGTIGNIQNFAEKILTISCELVLNPLGTIFFKKKIPLLVHRSLERLHQDIELYVPVRLEFIFSKLM